MFVKELVHFKDEITLTTPQKEILISSIGSFLTITTVTLRWGTLSKPIRHPALHYHSECEQELFCSNKRLPLSGNNYVQKTIIELIDFNVRSHICFLREELWIQWPWTLQQYLATHFAHPLSLCYELGNMAHV